MLGSQQEFPAGETETLELPFAHLHHMKGRKPKALKRDFFFSSLSIRTALDTDVLSS